MAMSPIRTGEELERELATMDPEDARRVARASATLMGMLSMQDVQAALVELLDPQSPLLSTIHIDFSTSMQGGALGPELWEWKITGALRRDVCDLAAHRAIRIGCTPYALIPQRLDMREFDSSVVATAYTLSGAVALWRG